MNLAWIDQRAFAIAGRFQSSHDSLEIAAVPLRHVEQHALIAKGVTNPLDERGKIDVVLVHLVDDDHPPDSRLFRLLEDPPRVHFDAAMSVDHDHRCIDRPERTNRLSNEIRVARRVDDIEPLAAVCEMRELGLDRPLVGLLFRVKVANARARIDTRLTRDRPRFDKQLVGQRRLAAASVAA
jgi:hypothetical protein